MRKVLLLLSAIVVLSIPSKAKAAEPADFVSNSLAEFGTIEVISQEEVQEFLDSREGINARGALLTSWLETKKEDGAVCFYFTTCASKIATEIGMKNFKLQVKDGLFWKTFSTQNPIIYNADLYAGGFRYTDPVKGKEYRSTGDHYVKVDGEVFTKYEISKTVIY